jgi:prepilin-type N-terminal cleavage/methylation domain-containing protein
VLFSRRGEVSRVRDCSRSRLGFTLVELLVVVGIIAVLASLLLAALASAREKARSIQCVAVLRQWGSAFRMYADDNSDFLPRRGQGVQVLSFIDRPTDWFNALPPYLASRSFEQLVTSGNKPAPHSASIFVCPSANDPGAPYFLSYAMNMNLSPWNLVLPTKFSAVSQPELLAAMADAPGPYASTFPSSHPYGVMARHRGRANLLFLAGSVQSFAASYIGCGTGDPHRNDIHWITGTESDNQVSIY